MRKHSAYPEKKALNLMIRERQGGDLRVLIPCLVVGVILLGLFCQYAVIGRLMEASRAENAALKAEQTLADAEQELKRYDEVQVEYSRYFSDALRSENMPQECMDVLAMMEKHLMGKAGVASLNFSGNTLMLQLNVSDLGVTSDLIEALYQVPMVEYVSISTATDTNAWGTRPTAPSDPASNTSTVILTITLQEVDGE